jgi:hypothetical protein
MAEHLKLQSKEQIKKRQNLLYYSCYSILPSSLHSGELVDAATFPSLPTARYAQLLFITTVEAKRTQFPVFLTLMNRTPKLFHTLKCFINIGST